MRLALAPDGKLVLTTAAPSELVFLDPLDGAILDRIPLANPDLGAPLALSRLGVVGDLAGQPAGATLYLEGVWSSVAQNEAVQTQPAVPNYVPTATATATASATPTSTPTASPTAQGQAGSYVGPPSAPPSGGGGEPTQQATAQPTQQPPTEQPMPVPTKCVYNPPFNYC